MLLSFGFVRVSRVECKSALYQRQASLLTMHNPVDAEKWAKDTRLYLGLIGPWRGHMGVRVAIFEVYEVRQ